MDSQALAAILKTGIFQGLLIPSSLVAGTSSSFWFYFYFRPPPKKIYIYSLRIVKFLVHKAAFHMLHEGKVIFENITSHKNSKEVWADHYLEIIKFYNFPN